MVTQLADQPHPRRRRRYPSVLLALLTMPAFVSDAHAKQELTLSPRAGLQAYETGVDQQRHSLQNALDKVVQAGSPGALAQVQKDGEIWNLSSGVADLKTGERPTAEMHFRIGSITKTFIATVVLQLVHENRVRLNDTVGRWLPGLVSGMGNNGRAITIRMLLNHTSGLYDYSKDQDLNGRLEQNRFLTVTPSELVRIAVGHPPSFLPGTSWDYSDTNYILLGMIIEPVSGNSYATEVIRRIIRPLHLQETYLPGTSPNFPEPYMHGYSHEGSEIEDTTQYNPSFLGASGEMISSMADLNHFFSALLSGNLLPDRLLRMMLTPTPGSGTDTIHYGFGILITEMPCGTTVYGNAGNIAGSQSWVATSRDGQHLLALNFNCDWLEQHIPLSMAATDAEFCAQKISK